MKAENKRETERVLKEALDKVKLGAGGNYSPKSTVFNIIMLRKICKCVELLLIDLFSYSCYDARITVVSVH